MKSWLGKAFDRNGYHMREEKVRGHYSARNLIKVLKLGLLKRCPFLNGEECPTSSRLVSWESNTTMNLWKKPIPHLYSQRKARMCHSSLAPISDHRLFYSHHYALLFTTIKSLISECRSISKRFIEPTNISDADHWLPWLALRTSTYQNSLPCTNFCRKGIGNHQAWK